MLLNSTSQLDSSYTSFSGSIPNTFGNLRFLCMLSLANNYLTTELSTAEWKFLFPLTNCRIITMLSLGSNLLLVIFISLIGNFFVSLQYVYDCKPKGKFPEEICNLYSLIVLNLFNNDLNGIIPIALGRLQLLQGLDLGNNILQGSISYNFC